MRPILSTNTLNRDAGGAETAWYETSWTLSSAIPKQKFPGHGHDCGQAGGAITGGYRGRILSGGFNDGTNEGIYLAANYNYLRGIHYDSGDMQVRFDTGADGLLTLQPTTTPFSLNRTTGKSGSGFAIDLAMAVVKERWDVSFGIDGVGNRINWRVQTGPSGVSRRRPLSRDLGILQRALA